MKTKRVLGKRIGAAVLAVALSFTALPIIGTAEKVEAKDYELVDNVQDAAILHCWNWSYDTISENMELIAECGYSAIQTSPVQQPKDYTYDGEVSTTVGIPGKGGSGNWWKLYQPVTFSICDNGQSYLGNKEEFTAMCDEAEKYGIKVIVDIVANHMGNITGWQNSLDDVSEQVGTYWNADMLTNEDYWHINAYQCWMSDSRLHFTQGSIGMPDLNTANKTVQQYVANYLDELIDCGADGFRFDAAKHIETPDDDPAYASDFWPTVLGEAESHYTEVTGGDLYVYGEILNTVGDNFSIDSYTKYMSVTDNSAGNHLLEAFRNGNVNTLSMDYAADVSVLWAESHDTYMNESSRYASDKSIVRTWAMVANKDNAAALFFARPYYSSDILVDDQDGSFRSDLETSLTQATMGECSTYVWASKEVAAINHFNNRFVNYSDNMGTDGNIAYCQRGNGIVIVNFNGAGNVSMSAHGMADGTYTDEVSGNTFTVSGGVISGNITSEYGIAVVYQNVVGGPSVTYPVQVAASVGDGSVFYTDGIDVTVSAQYATSASYTTTTGQSGTFTDSADITVGQGLADGESVTLTVTASNSEGTKSASYTYTKASYNLSNCVFFKNTKGWSGVTAYMWNDSTSNITTNASWPGKAMFECDAANNIWAVAVDGDYTKIIFSNSGSSQTADLAIGQVGYCYDPSTGEWTKYGQTVTYPSISASVPGGMSFEGSLEVTYTVANATSASVSVNGTVTEFTDSITVTLDQTSTVEVTATNENGSKSASYTYTRNYVLPTVSISQDSCDFIDSIEVTVTATNATKATYTIETANGSATYSFTDSKTITVGSDLGLGDSVTVSVNASNADGEANPVCAVYTKTEAAEENYVFLNVNSCSWFGNDSAVAVYKTDKDSQYTKMDTCTCNDGSKVFFASIPSDATTITFGRMIPNGNVYNTKTVSLTKDYFVSDSNWNNLSAQNYPGPYPNGGQGQEQTKTVTVYFENTDNWSTVNIYAWGGSCTATSWPGVAMTKVGSSNGHDLYSYTVAADATGIIFTNGSGAQTVDINEVANATYALNGYNGSKRTVSITK